MHRGSIHFFKGALRANLIFGFFSHQSLLFAHLFQAHLKSRGDFGIVGIDDLVHQRRRFPGKLIHFCFGGFHA
ncbi:MAG: hypothetical protein ACFBZ9_10870 [Sphingomonadales bacterium]